MKSANTHLNRRDLLRLTGAGAVASAMPMSPLWAQAGRASPPVGWEAEPMRWFQLAFTEDDPGNFDPEFWLDYFRRIHAEGVCLSAGGGTAFYPTQIPDHGVARGLNGRDPFGMMVEACKDMGLRILARVDPHAMYADVFERHPNWAAYDVEGNPRRHWTATDLYLTCPYTEYNFEFMPHVLREIIANYEVDGLFGNRVNSLGACWCPSCQTLFREETGQSIPTNVDPGTEAGRRYWAWAEKRSVMLFELWKEVVTETHPGMIFVSASERRMTVPVDAAKLADKVPIGFGDRQGRSTDSRFLQGNRVWTNGRYVEDIAAWLPGKPFGAIVSVGVEEPYRWKDSVQDEAELRIWMASAMAHGARPWITKFNAKPFDQRWMPVVEDIYNWHHANEDYLRNEESAARICLVMDQRMPPLLGGFEREDELEQYRIGFYQALLESRLPFSELDAAFLTLDYLRKFRLVILPNLAMMSEEQCDAIRQYVAEGGRVVATHETSLYDLDTNRRDNFLLADLFGCDFDGNVEERVQNSYLTLRHPSPMLEGIPESEQRVIAPVKRVHVAQNGEILPPPLTLVPSYEDLPMERVYTDTPFTDIPMAYCREVGEGRVVYLPMDLERTFAEIGHGGHLRLLKAFIDWAADETPPVTVEGPGLYDVTAWRQANSLTAHIVNYTNPMAMANAWREVVPSPPLTVSIAVPDGAQVSVARLLEDGETVPVQQEGNRVTVEIGSVRYHEVVALDLA